MLAIYDVAKASELMISNATNVTDVIGTVHQRLSEAHQNFDSDLKNHKLPMNLPSYEVDKLKNVPVPYLESRGYINYWAAAEMSLAIFLHLLIYWLYHYYRQIPLVKEDDALPYDLMKEATAKDRDAEVIREEELVEKEMSDGTGENWNDHVCLGSKIVKSFTDTAGWRIWATRNVSILI